VFDRAGEQSRVHHQPEGGDERLAALKALLACPTASIGTAAPAPEMKRALAAFPDPVAGAVHHCGFHAESSFGAASWFIRRPDGNVLVDSPRFAAPLVRRIEELGGVAWMFLTHRDDVADHEKWAGHFGADRILHAADVAPGTRGVERQLAGTEPVSLADDLLVIPTPGHTRGSACLLFAPDEAARRTGAGAFLFTGDHIAWSARLQHLYAFRGVCWHDWDELVASAARLLQWPFEWVLPGHGRVAHLAPAAMATSLRQGLAWMETA
jgi:glyoxylase-like metal-dependent hydrolase (beta-lactamase superfamily II)